MAFTVRGKGGLDDATAQQHVNASLAYLRRSPLAKSILDDLEKNGNVCIDVDPTSDDYYAHPESSYNCITRGGTAVWNPTKGLEVTDSARLRPDQAWVPQHKERARVEIEKRGLEKKIADIFKLSPTRKVWINQNAKKFGMLSAHMCLMHELGHALQYATYPDQFLEAKGLEGPLGKIKSQEALETTNLYCVEIPIALELKAQGYDETPRWDYSHSGHF